MTDAILGFRTITRAWIDRYVYEGTPPVLVAKPIGLPLPPENADIAPNVAQGEIGGKSMTGELTTELMYVTEAKGQVSMDFGLGTPEIETFIHSRINKSFTDWAEFVYFEATARTATVAAKTTGQYGSTVAAQTAATTKAKAYYIDPDTKLTVPVSVVDATPTGDQIIIGAGTAITFSPELVEKEAMVRGWVPAIFAKATAMTQETLKLCGVYMTGVSFDGTMKLFRARNCVPMFGGSISGGQPNRQISFKILPDPGDGTCLGWQWISIPDTVSC